MISVTTKALLDQIFGTEQRGNACGQHSLTPQIQKQYSTLLWFKAQTPVLSHHSTDTPFAVEIEIHIFFSLNIQLMNK